MMLPDHEITALASRMIDPFDPKLVQPASYDIRLGPVIMRPAGPYYINPADKPDLQYETVNLDDVIEFWIRPDAFILASTVERVCIPANVLARVEGKSSLGRLGLAVHITAGFIDPGFEGHITLEIKNVGPYAIRLSAGMRIGQLAFTQLTSPPLRPYGHPDLGSHYQGQGPEPVGSR